MEHSPIKMDYATFQSAKGMQLEDEQHTLSKYLGKNWADSTEPRVAKGGKGKKARPRTALGLSGSSSRPGETKQQQAAITIVPHKGAFTTKKMGLLCKCCGHMLSTHFTDLDVSGASTILATSPSLMAKRKKTPSKAPKQQSRDHSHVYHRITDISAASLNNSMGISRVTSHGQNGTSDFGARSNLLWEIRRSLMDEFSPIPKGKQPVERDTLRKATTTTSVTADDSSRLMLSMASTIKELERSKLDLAERLSAAQASRGAAMDAGGGHDTLVGQLKEAQVQHISSLERQIGELEARLAEAAEKAERTGHGRSAAEVGRAVAEAEVGRLTGVTVELERRLLGEIAELERRLEASVKAAEEARRATDSTRLAEQESALQRALANLGEQQEQFLEVRRNSQAEIETLEAKLAEARKQAAARPTVPPKSSGEHDDEMASLTRVALRIKAENQGLKAENEALRAENQTVKQQVKEAESEVTGAELQRLELKGRLGLLEGAHREMGALKEISRTCEAARMALETKLAVAQEEARRLAGKERELEAARQEALMLKGRISELEGQLRVERAAGEELNESVQELVKAQKDMTPRVVRPPPDGTASRTTSTVMTALVQAVLRLEEEAFALGESARAWSHGREESSAAAEILEALHKVEMAARKTESLAGAVGGLGKPVPVPVPVPAAMPAMMMLRPEHGEHLLFGPQELEVMEQLNRGAADSVPWSSRVLKLTTLRQGGQASMALLQHAPALPGDANEGVLRRRNIRSIVDWEGFSPPVYSNDCFAFGRSAVLTEHSKTSPVLVVTKPKSPSSTLRPTLRQTPKPTPRQEASDSVTCPACKKDRRLRTCLDCFPGLNITASGRSMIIISNESALPADTQ